MATTKWARHKFVVKESATEAREIREGFVDLVADPYLVAEPCDSKPISEYPLEGSDFLALELIQGTSMKQAQDIAAFLNTNVSYLSITRFGDREDAIRDVRQSAHVRSIDAERFAMVVAMLAEKIQGNNAGEIHGALVAVQSVSADLLAGWSKALQLSDDILNAFGEDEDPHV
ncbi:MAG: hypothetical protein LAO24_25000 [Acidobacteriia bacterium]|nr:hypothetical protein [Terriglobia bacterium]